MIHHIEINGIKLKQLVKSKTIKLAGNRKLKIYGSLNQCHSGKRMKIENRVFFTDEKEAVSKGYRPCGNCMPIAYAKWKKGQ